MVASRSLVGFLLVLAACTPNIEDTEGRPSAAVPAGSTLVQVDPEGGAVGHVVPVGIDPFVITSSAGTVYVVGLDRGDLRSVDAATGESSVVDIGPAAGVVADGDSIWVTAEGRSLIELDAATGAVRRRLTLDDEPIFGPRDGGMLTVGGGSLWIAVDRGGTTGEASELWRVDPDSGEVEDRIAIGHEPVFPVFVDGAIWLVSMLEERLQRVDAATGRLTEARTHDAPLAVAVGAGDVWVTTTAGIDRIDARTGALIDTLDVPDELARGVFVRSGTIWVATEVSVLGLDPGNGDVTHEVTLVERTSDEGPFAMTWADGSLWVAIE
jgi:streptogramin lyase